MVRKDIEKKQIVEEYKKRFAQILEFTMGRSSDVVTEDDEETPQDGQEDAPTDSADMQGGDMMGGDPNAMPQDDPNMGGMEDPNAMGDDTNIMDPNAGAAEDVAGGFNPQGAEGDMQGPNMMGDDTSMMQPDDEVVDITDLTDAQEATQEEISQFDEKFTKAISAIKSLEDLIKQNDSKIDALETELKKRNPTPMEKMNNRRTISYPFNVSPEDYWKEKESEGVYSTEDDNNGKDSEEYTITAGDINNGNNWKTISDSLDNFMYNQTLDNLLKF